MTNLGGSCALVVGAEEGEEGWEDGATGLWVRERHFPPFSLALFFKNVHGWGIVESWRKSCLCCSRSRALPLRFVCYSFFCWSGLHAATLVKPSPSLCSGDVSGVWFLPLPERVKYTGSRPSHLIRVDVSLLLVVCSYICLGYFQLSC